MQGEFARRNRLSTESTAVITLSLYLLEREKSVQELEKVKMIGARKSFSSEAQFISIAR